MLAAIHADSWQDAQERCKSIGYSGRIIGNRLVIYPANDRDRPQAMPSLLGKLRALLFGKG